MRSILDRRRNRSTGDGSASTGKRRRAQLVLAGLGTAAAGAVMTMFSGGVSHATTTVSINPPAQGTTVTCFVAVQGKNCSYSAAKSALASTDTLGADLTLDVPGWDSAGLKMTVDTGSYQFDDGNDSIVIEGNVDLPETGTTVPAQFSASWGAGSGSTTPPNVAFAVKVEGGTDLSALNQAWNVPGLNLSLGTVLLAVSPNNNPATPDTDYVLDGSNLPATSTFLQGFAPMALHPGLNMHAEVVAGSQPAAVTNVLNYIGLTGDDSTSIDGTVANTAELLFDAKGLSGSGVDLTLNATSTGGSLPSWISSRTSSLEFKVGDDGPAVAVSDDLQTSINGSDNEFKGSTTYDATSADSTSLSIQLDYVGAIGTFSPPLGLDSLSASSISIDSASIGLSMTTGDTPTFSGSLDVGVTVNSTPLALHADLTASSGIVTATFSISGDVSLPDAVAVGNALLGTDVTAPDGTDDISLTGVTFSFQTGDDLQFALEASTSIRSATADVLVSIEKNGTDPVKFFAGAHVADLDVNDLLASPSDALQGLTFPNVDLFVSSGYLDNGKATDVPWDQLLPAQQTFFTDVYGGTPPDTVTFGPQLVFDGTVTMPDAISTMFSSDAPLHLHGELGFGFDALGTGDAPKMSGSLTAELPGITGDWVPDWLSGSTWSLKVAADNNGAVQISLEGDDITATIDGTDYPVTIEGTFTHTSEGTSIDLAGSISGEIDGVFGASWLNITDPSVKLGIEHTTDGTKFSASFDGDVTIDPNTDHSYSFTVSIEFAKGSGGTEGSVEVTSDPGSTASVGFADLATFFGASADDLSGQGSLTLTAIHGKATYSTDAGETLDLVADTSLDFGGTSPLNTQVLLSIRHTTTTNPPATNVIVGFRTLDAVNLSDIVPADALPKGVNLEFDTFALVVAHPAVTLKATDMLPEEADFFSAFCDDPDSACHDKISIGDGISFISATKIPSSVSDLIGAISIDPNAPVLVTGTIPVFGGDQKLALKVDLPEIQGSGDTPDFFQSGQVSLQVDESGFSVAGTITFNIPKTDATTESACTDLFGVWRAQRGTGTMGCYDQVPFTLSAAIQLGSGPPSMTLTGGLQQGYTWHAPNGASWLDINAATIKFGITAGTPIEFELGFRLAASVTIDSTVHDFDVSMLLGIEPLEAPPFIAIDPKGFRFASGSGLSMQDMVDLANLITGKSFSLGSVPNIAIRNMIFSFAEQNDTDLCLQQGIHIAADLYINPSKDAKIVTPADGCPQSEPDRTQICKTDQSNGCFAAVDFAINDQGLHASGTIGGFGVGPLNFNGADIDLQITKSTQHLVLEGGASIQGFASGQIDLLISDTELHFRGVASLFGTDNQAFIDAKASLPGLGSLADLEAGGDFSVTAVLKSDFLNQAAVAISGTLQQLKPVLDVMSSILLDVDQGHILTALTEIPTKVAQLGVSLPEPYGSALKDVSDKLSSIQSAISAFDHDVSWGLDQLLNGFTLSFPGIPGFVTPAGCITTEQDGKCWTTPPVDTFLGTIPGIPGVEVPATCVTTWGDDGNCYTVPPITGVHIPGLCDDLHKVISTIPAPCDGTSISNNLLLPVLRAIILKTSGYDIGNVDLHTVLTDIQNAFGSGQTVSIDCAEFQATAKVSTSPSASVHLSADFNIFGNKLTAGVGWDFSSPDLNPGTVVKNLIQAFLDPSLDLNDTCGLPDDWNTNSDFPDMLGTAPSTGGDTPPPPTPTLALQFAHPTIDEGSSASLTGTETPKPSSDQSVTINWGDGSTATTATLDHTTGTFTATKTFSNNTPVGQPSAQYNVGASVDSGPSSSAMLTVANVAPSNLVLTPSSSSIDEGSSITLTGTFDDPGSNDTHTVSIDWGDKSTSSLTLGAGVKTFTTAAHTYVDNNVDEHGNVLDSYTVSATVTDDDLATASKTATIDVANVAPRTISIVQLCPATPAVTPVPACTTATTPEQQLQSFRFTFSDPGVNDTTTAVVDWGDGTAQQTVTLGTLRTLTLSHVWTEADTASYPDGQFPVSVTLTDKDGGVGTKTLTEAVTNVAPTTPSLCLLDVTDPTTDLGKVCPQSSTINEGDTISLAGSFTDVSALDTHTVQIDWGPGWPTATRYETQSLGVGVFSFTGTRAFGDEGTYAIKVTVTDDDGAYADRTVAVTVNNVAPTAAIDHTGTYSVQGVDAFLGHANHSLSFTGYSDDPGNDDLTLAWAWRDGTTTSHGFPNDPANADDSGSPDPENPTVDPRSITDNESHTWSSPCPYTPQLSSTDGDVRTPTTDAVDVVITGNDPSRYASGTWISTYKNKTVSSTLLCDLKIVQRMSAVFTGPSSRATTGNIDLTTPSEAYDVVHSSSSDSRLKLERQVLTMWLDFASGGFDYTTMLDTNGDGVPDTSFADAMATAEQLILNPASTQSQMLSYRNRLAPLTGDV